VLSPPWQEPKLPWDALSDNIVYARSYWVVLPQFHEKLKCRSRIQNVVKNLCPCRSTPPREEWNGWCRARAREPELHQKGKYKLDLVVVVAWHVPGRTAWWCQSAWQIKATANKAILRRSRITPGKCKIQEGLTLFQLLAALLMLCVKRALLFRNMQIFVFSFSSASR
jgi:hypothetical protein